MPQANQAIPVSPEVEEVIREGIYWSEQSSGAFDITVEPLVQLWDFDGEKEIIPEGKHDPQNSLPGQF